MKLRYTALAIFVGMSVLSKADVTINLGVGVLSNSSGVSIPDGALIQLIASTTDNVFSPVSSTSFTGGSADDAVIASFASNSASSGVAGATIKVLTITYSGSLNAGDQILLRWFPTLTTSSASPGAGVPYGEFRSASVSDGSNINWTLPADGGGTYTLNFLTQSAGGSQANTLGQASNTAVPEPTSMTLALAAGAVGLLRRRRRL